MSSAFPASLPYILKLEQVTGLPLRTSTEESSNAYLDQSLAILGHAALDQVKQLEAAIRHQADYVRGANLDAYRDQLDRDSNILGKLGDFDREHSKCLHEIEEQLQKLGSSLQGVTTQCASVAVLNARQSNLTKVRPYQTIERVPHIRRGSICWADKEIHPKRVKDLWQMAHQSQQRRNLHQLLMFYDVKTVCVPPTDAVPTFDESDDDDEEEEEIETAAAVFRNQKACAEILASHLGVDFARMEVEVEKLAEFKRRADTLHHDAERRRRQGDREEEPPRTRIKTQAHNTGRTQTQVRVTQEQSSGTSITSPRSNTSAPHWPPYKSSSPSRLSDSVATQRLESDSDG